MAGPVDADDIDKGFLAQPTLRAVPRVRGTSVERPLRERVRSVALDSSGGDVMPGSSVDAAIGVDDEAVLGEFDEGGLVQSVDDRVEVRV